VGAGLKSRAEDLRVLVGVRFTAGVRAEGIQASR
jgi:hypothetical protein